MNPSNHALDRWFNLLAGAVILFCLYFVATSINAARTTSVLKVSSTDDKTVLTISQVNKQAEFIGTGQVNIRLKPGTYTVAASQKGKQVFKDVQILKDQNAAVTLDPQDAVILPSVAGIDFEGFDELIDGGLTTGQVDRLKSYLFQFKPAAKKMMVSEGSFRPAPRDPDTAIGFSSTFNIFIDSAPHAVKIHYSDPSNPEGIRLYLYNSAGTIRLFDSGRIK